jgi:hypothetical protein
MDHLSRNSCKFPTPIGFRCVCLHENNVNELLRAQCVPPVRCFSRDRQYLMLFEHTRAEGGSAGATRFVVSVRSSLCQMPVNGDDRTDKEEGTIGLPTVHGQVPTVFVCSICPSHSKHQLAPSNHQAYQRSNEASSYRYEPAHTSVLSSSPSPGRTQDAKLSDRELYRPVAVVLLQCRIFLE